MNSEEVKSQASAGAHTPLTVLEKEHENKKKRVRMEENSKGPKIIQWTHPMGAPNSGSTPQSSTVQAMVFGETSTPSDGKQEEVNVISIVDGDQGANEESLEMLET